MTVRSFAYLEKTGAQGHAREPRLERYFDMRYVGQSYELTIPEGASFHAAHQ